MLVENTLFEKVDKVYDSIRLLQEFAPEEGYYVAFSGGKDSIVIKDLCLKAGVKFDIHYQNTTIDPPELIQFIRNKHPDVEMHYPEQSYFKELVKRGFPMRRKKWCCEFLKEYGGIDRMVVTGIRHAESARRRKRKCIEPCSKQQKWFLHPIITWSELDVWEYIKSYDLPYCRLYDEGFKRIGCIGCPNAYWKTRIKELERYPRIKKAYQKAFNKLYDKNKERESYRRWNSGEEMFQWWLTNKAQNEDMPLFA